MKRYSWSTDFMEWWDDGDYVLYSDHEAEVARLRAEVEGLKSKADELSMLHVETVQDKGHLEIKYRNACHRAGRDRKDAERYRWLRDLPQDHPSEEIGNMPGDMWDEQIDAAMGEGK